MWGGAIASGSRGSLQILGLLERTVVARIVRQTIEGGVS
eukprot:CAMPEP_0180739056 /NCGR_PEP_ID=MMETSP1038_2-20121128/25139_1 /TAXON_ID=632150 /ORGANISM="Azadinium spinosum, Strain 3D9" /LENGTH=38 /DNA_ID= /DNA_START= /DNA_END= /DNA_ORIENTATION=